MLFVLAVVLVGLLPSAAQADRVVSISIQVNGKEWLRGFTTDNGSPPPAVVWRFLNFTELQVAEGVTVTADSDDPLRATLRGKIAIDVQYGGKAEVEELRLVRRSSEDKWTVAPDDVERIADTIGLRDVPVVSPGPSPSTGNLHDASGGDAFPWLWLAVGVAAVLVILVAYTVIRRGGVSRAEPGVSADPRGRD